ncbi:MAG: sn-glycerol-3-phosphate ABC transporter permease UgpA [Hyphomicrobiales bacterium]|nr:MAG: sn-glycerol-3-phosphate ABC transporter permease UgpA [Hyphomicrobiales bacterium]
MQKNAYFTGLTIPLLLLLPQLAITVVFFYWPASQAVWQSFLLQDAFGTSTEFVWFENYQMLFSDPGYLKAFINTAIFSTFVCVLSLSIALLFAVMADRAIRGAEIFKTLLIWPYAVAPAVAGVLWLFMFDPSLGMLARGLSDMGIAWNPRLNGNDAMLLVILAATWKQISYNFLFFLAGLQSIPKSVIEAAVIDGAKPWRRFWTIVFPLLSPTTFFLLVVNIVYVFFDTFGIIDTITGGGPSGATETLVYKVFSDGKGGSNLGGSAAQSVVLLVMVIGMTAVQFKFIERRVSY